MLRRSSLVECVNVLHGTCLQCVEKNFYHQYVQPCLSKNPKYTFYTIKSSLTLAYNLSVCRFLVTDNLLNKLALCKLTKNMAQNYTNHKICS